MQAAIEPSQDQVILFVEETIMAMETHRSAMVEVITRPMKVAEETIQRVMAVAEVNLQVATNLRMEVAEGRRPQKPNGGDDNNGKESKKDGDADRRRRRRQLERRREQLPTSVKEVALAEYTGDFSTAHYDP